MEANYKESRVLFVRGLPLDATEDELARVLGVYGRVEKVLLLI